MASPSEALTPKRRVSGFGTENQPLLQTPDGSTAMAAGGKGLTAVQDRCLVRRALVQNANILNAASGAAGPATPPQTGGATIGISATDGLCSPILVSPSAPRLASTGPSLGDLDSRQLLEGALAGSNAVKALLAEKLAAAAASAHCNAVAGNHDPADATEARIQRLSADLEAAESARLLAEKTIHSLAREVSGLKADLAGMMTTATADRLRSERSARALADESARATNLSAQLKVAKATVMAETANKADLEAKLAAEAGRANDLAYVGVRASVLVCLCFTLRVRV